MAVSFPLSHLHNALPDYTLVLVFGIQDQHISQSMSRHRTTQTNPSKRFFRRDSTSPKDRHQPIFHLDDRPSPPIAGGASPQSSRDRTVIPKLTTLFQPHAIGPPSISRHGRLFSHGLNRGSGTHPHRSDDETLLENACAYERARSPVHGHNPSLE